MDRNDKMEIKNRLAIYFSTLVMVIITGCTGSPPRRDEIAGTWVNQAQDASITFGANGTFSSKNLPADLFWNRSYSGKKISGSGNWKIVEGPGEWDIELSFSFTSLQELQSFTTTIFLSKDDSSWYAYVWEEEEGGQRYKFKKDSAVE